MRGPKPHQTSWNRIIVPNAENRLSIITLPGDELGQLPARFLRQTDLVQEEGR